MTTVLSRGCAFSPHGLTLLFLLLKVTRRALYSVFVADFIVKCVLAIYTSVSFIYIIIFYTLSDIKSYSFLL